MSKAAVTADQASTIMYLSTLTSKLLGPLDIVFDSGKESFTLHATFHQQFTLPVQT
jgi:hypothetical protein